MNIDNEPVKMIKDIIDMEEQYVLENKNYFKCLLVFNDKSAKVLLSHFFDRVNEARVITNLEDTKRAFQGRKSLLKRTRCVIGILWQPQQEEIGLLEAVLVERTTKLFIILVLNFEILLLFVH